MAAENEAPLGGDVTLDTGRRPASMRPRRMAAENAISARSATLGAVLSLQ